MVRTNFPADRKKTQKHQTVICINDDCEIKLLQDKFFQELRSLFLHLNTKTD